MTISVAPTPSSTLDRFFLHSAQPKPSKYTPNQWRLLSLANWIATRCTRHLILRSMHKPVRCHHLWLSGLHHQGSVITFMEHRDTNSYHVTSISDEYFFVVFFAEHTHWHTDRKNNSIMLARTNKKWNHAIRETLDSNGRPIPLTAPKPFYRRVLHYIH